MARLRQKSGEILGAGSSLDFSDIPAAKRFDRAGRNMARGQTRLFIHEVWLVLVLKHIWQMHRANLQTLIKGTDLGQMLQNKGAKTEPADFFSEAASA